MDLISFAVIEVVNRQRKTFPEEDARDLETSIMEKGLFQAIGVEEMSPNNYQLRFGERRLRAMTKLHASGIPFFHAGQLVPQDMLPCTLWNNLTERQRQEIELEENLRRKDLTWQERVQALALLGELTEREAPSERNASIAKITGMTETSSRQMVAQAIAVKATLHVPSVAGARTMAEAYKASLKHNEDNFLSELNRRAMKAPNKVSLIEPRRGNMIEILPTLDTGVFDAIICDPPYGYDADTTFGQKVETKHLYRDDEEYARSIYKLLLTEGFRITKPRAHIFMFCKPMLFSFLCETAARMAWTPFSSPILWKKGPGYAPWGNSGFRRNYEMIFWAVKGQRGLNYLVEDIIEVPSSRTKEHGAEKPVELMEALINACTVPNDLILDPCMGSGSTMVAAKNLKRRGVGIELDNDYFNMAMARLADKVEEPVA